MVTLEPDSERSTATFHAPCVSLYPPRIHRNLAERRFFGSEMMTVFRIHAKYATCISKHPAKRCAGPRVALCCSHELRGRCSGQHGCGRATRTGRASPAARALQTRLIIGPWPHIMLGVVGRGSTCACSALVPSSRERWRSRGLGVCLGRGCLGPAQILEQNSIRPVSPRSCARSTLFMAVRVHADEFCPGVRPPRVCRAYLPVVLTFRIHSTRA